MAEKVVRSSLVDQVHSFIIKRIQRREILPGDRLNIEELAKEFGVSRTPVREAISRLTQEGFVVQNHNAGPCVADFGKEQGLDIIIANAKLFDCVFQMMPGEAEVDSMVAELEEIIQQQEETLHDNDTAAFHSASVQFHVAIIERCTNATLRQFTLQTEYRMNMLALYYQVAGNYKEKSISDHKEILESIRQRNWAYATELMAVHNGFALNYFAQSSENT